MSRVLTDIVQTPTYTERLKIQCLFNEWLVLMNFLSQIIRSWYVLMKRQNPTDDSRYRKKSLKESKKIHQLIDLFFLDWLHFTEIWIYVIEFETDI